MLRRKNSILINKHVLNRKPVPLRKNLLVLRLYTTQVPPGEVTQQNLTRGGSAPRFNPLPFYIPFLKEKVPLSCTFHWGAASPYRPLIIIIIIMIIIIIIIIITVIIIIIMIITIIIIIIIIIIIMTECDPPGRFLNPFLSVRDVFEV